jgi:hypothetical protein
MAPQDELVQFALTRQHVERLAGRPLTDAQITQLSQTIFWRRLPGVLEQNACVLVNAALAAAGLPVAGDLDLQG